ncbi:MAG: SDR family NAD(P)-dependent oxidoreductase, partial [Acidobacteria bacterium]|nr:SDR family NAD(P)-dependent oxidoreductase [Acidobacteriota bacterium]
MNREVFLVTGAASGIGRHLTSRLLDAGGRVLATDIDPAALELGAAELGWPVDQVRLRRLDVRDENDWRAAIDEAVGIFGRIDVV